MRKKTAVKEVRFTKNTDGTVTDNLLVDYDKRDPAIDKEFFPDTKSSYYWTSTPLCGDSGYGWIVLFYNGNVNYDHRGNSNYVRPVRPCK